MAQDGNDEDLYEVDDEPQQYGTAEMPDDEKQDSLIALSKENIDSFRIAIVKIMNDNSDKFNVLELNKDNDGDNTIMTKESFATTFDGTFKTELLNIIFDLIDENSVGTISNAALISFMSNKSKHPRFQTTQIDSRWLLNTIKQMNFGQIDLNSDNKVSLDEMTKFFEEKNVGEDIVKLVFEDIVKEQEDKEFISYKTFFAWRDKQFNPQKIRSWSHTLSQTVVLVGLEDLLKEISDNGDDFEVIDHENASGETKSNNDEDDFQEIQNVDTSTNQNQLLHSICDIMQLDKDDIRNEKLEDVIKTEFQKLQYQLAEATYDKIRNTKKANEQEEEAKLMKTEVIKHKAATKQIARELSDIVGRHVNTDDPKELLDVIKELQHKLANAIQDKQRAINDQQPLRDDIARLQHQLADHKLAMRKLKKELSETLGTHKEDDDPEVVNELFKKLQYQLAEEKIEALRQRRASVAMKEKLEKANYELSDERYQRLQLKDSIQTILDLDLNEINDIESVKDLVTRLQQDLGNEYGPSDKMKLNDESEQAQLAKADEAIKKVDIEEELKNLEDDEDDADYMKMTDINKLKRIIKSLKGEIRESRTNHLAVSETKTHLEVQTFDLQTKLTVEKKKYSKLLRMSQQMANFDPSVLQMDEEDGDNKEDGAYDNEDDEESADHFIQHTIDLAGAANAYVAGDMEMSDDDGDEYGDADGAYDSDAAQSVNIHPDVEHHEEWNGTAQELEDKIARLQEEIAGFKEENTNLKQELTSTRKQSTVFESEIEKLRSTNRNHRRRESEVFTQIGSDAKNVVAQLEEFEEQRQQMEDKELQLQYLKAEQQRMQIAYEHAKTNAANAKQQASTMRKQIKDLENKAAAAGEMEELKNKLADLEATAREHENLELELAFYKAEKLRQDVKFDFKERTLKETKQENKELKETVKTEKDKVRRLSKQIEVSDIEKLNQGRDENGDRKTESEWNAEMEQLKQRLVNEQMEKSALITEKQQLQQRLSNAESTQVNQLLQYVKTEKEFEENQVPPPPGNDSNDNIQRQEQDDDEEDEDEVSDLDGQEHDEEDEDGDDEYEDDEDDRSNHIEQEMESLKFKLANAELQNAQLKRRVSIAGMEKEALSLLWEQPRVTIQMVSEFIERLPLKHKEKIWARHATGQYIAKNKILHTLHSFVALCIKIKDRTAVAPSRHDIEKKLVPFADVIRQRTENANGMSLDEFNQELHFWILEPVSGLVMTTDEQRQWMEEIDALREELVKAQKEKLRIQRKSQMDLTVLLDKMKGFEQSDNSDMVDDFKLQITELQEMNDQFQEDIRDKDEEINRLTEENQTLIAGRDKARDSEEDEDEEEEEEESEEAPQLIDESQQKTLSEFRELQKEDEFAEERLEFYQNDSNVTKNQTYIGWKRKAEGAKKQIENLERDRKQSVEQVKTLKKTVEQLQSAKQAETSKHETQIQQFQAEIQKFKKKYQESDKIRKDSISTLHDNLFAKLLEAEAEHEEMVADYKQQIGKLQKANKAFETSMNAMATTKVDTIQQLDGTIQELRESVSALSKQVEILKRKNNELENRTTIQTLQSSFSSFF